jgi:hypothetical protein
MSGVRILAAALCAAASALAFAPAHAGTNLISNGDFSNGFSGFTSGYTQDLDVNNQSSGYPEQLFAIVTNPNQVHNLWDSFTAPAGLTNMMTVNGGYTPNLDFWATQSSLAVTPDTTYKFTMQVAGNYPVSPADLQLFVNGAPQGSDFTVSSNAGQWQTFTATWNSGSATSASLALQDLNLTRSGNDFSIDGLSFAAVPEPATWAMTILGVAMIGAAARRRSQGIAVLAA